MNLLKLEPLTPDLLPAVVELDRRSLGGLWSSDGYRREIESPNSDLLVLRQAIDQVGSEVDAPSPPNSGGLPSRQSESFVGREVISRQSTAFSQSPPELGDLGGDAETLTSTITPTIQPSQLSSGSLIGLGCLWAIAEEAHITILAIDPDYRQQGLGQAILYALLVAAQRRGLEWATLEVRASNEAANRLYEKFGFREVGRRKGYYADGEDALILWRSGLQKPEFRLWIQDCQRQIADRLGRSGYQIRLEPAPETAFT